MGNQWVFLILCCFVTCSVIDVFWYAWIRFAECFLVMMRLDESDDQEFSCFFDLISSHWSRYIIRLEWAFVSLQLLLLVRRIYSSVSRVYIWRSPERTFVYLLIVYLSELRSRSFLWLHLLWHSGFQHFKACVFVDEVFINARPWPWWHENNPKDSYMQPQDFYQATTSAISRIPKPIFPLPQKNAAWSLSSEAKSDLGIIASSSCKYIKPNSLLSGSRHEAIDGDD